MTVLTNFDIANDLKVQMYLPLSGGNTFVLGISQLGGNNVLGDDNSGIYGWVNLEVEVNRVQTEIGGQVSTNTYFQADSGRLDVSMQSWTFDPNNHSAMLPNTPVRIILSRGIYQRIIWNGLLESINVTYNPDEPNQIQIKAVDYWNFIVQRRFDFEPLGLGDYGYLERMYPSEAIEIALTQMATVGEVIPYTPETDPEHEWFMTQTSQLNATFGTVVQNILNTGLGFIWVDPNDGYLKYRPRKQSGTATYTVGNNHGETGHLCMADISSSTNTDGIINSFLIEQKYQYQSDPLFKIAAVDQDSIDIFGERSSDLNIDLAQETDAQTFVNALVIPRPPTIVEEVLTPTVDRLGNLTEASLFMPGDYIGISYITDKISIVDTYTITKVSHSIDRNNWFTRLQLWKEF